METFVSLLDKAVSLWRWSKRYKVVYMQVDERKYSTWKYLAGEAFQNQVTFSLNFRRTWSRLQFKPGVIASNRDLLQERISVINVNI